MKKITFIGGGHSNTVAIRSLMQKFYKNESGSDYSTVLGKYQFNLISEYNNSAYSGMIPGNICGYYTKDESFIDLEKFAKIHNCKFIQKKVKSIIPNSKKIIFEDGGESDFDLLSINIGSRTYNGRGLKGVEEYTIQTRPINNLMSKIENKEKELETEINTESIKIAIIGSGVSGIELAFSIQHRLKRNLGKNSTVTIFSNQKSIIPDFEKNVSDHLLNLANERDIKILTNSECVEVKERTVVYKKDNSPSKLAEEKNFDLIVWATGAEPQKIDSNLDLDKRGFILVRDTLQSLRYDNIFAAGDCIQIDRYKDNLTGAFPPKSGVYAVREGAILAENIFEFLKNENNNKDIKLKNYTPQTSFLKLITTGNKFAFGTKFGLSFYGKWVWNLKEFIDSNFVKMFYKDLSYDNTLTFDKINTPDNFSYTPEACIEKLINSQNEEDFTIQLKIIDKLATDNDLLIKIKNILKI